MITGADAPSKHAPLLPVHLNERMKVGRLVEVLEQLPFNSRDEGSSCSTAWCEIISSTRAKPLLAILTKQFTTRWPDVARSGDERSPLPAALVR